MTKKIFSAPAFPPPSIHPSIAPSLCSPLLLPSATSWACWRRRLCGGWSLLVGEGKEQRDFGGFWGWMRSSERATRVGAVAAAADSHSRPPPPPFKNTSWHTHTHMHIFTHNKTSRHCPLIGLNPSICAMWAWKTHGGQHGKPKLCTCDHRQTHTCKGASLILIGWSAAEAGRGELRSHGACAAVILYCSQGQVGLHQQQQGKGKGEGWCVWVAVHDHVLIRRPHMLGVVALSGWCMCARVRVCVCVCEDRDKCVFYCESER